MKVIVQFLFIVFFAIFILPLMLAPLLMLVAMALPSFITPQGMHEVLGLPHNFFNNFYHFNSMPLFLLSLVFILVVGFICIKIMKLLFSKDYEKVKEVETEDAHNMQEMFRGLSRLEKRVETLETILMDRMDQSIKRG